MSSKDICNQSMNSNFTTSIAKNYLNLFFTIYNFDEILAQGKWYLFIEASSQAYRNSVPIQPWLHYLLESYQGPHKVVGVFLSALYMVSKGNLVMSAFKLWWMSFVKVLRNVVSIHTFVYV